MIAYVDCISHQPAGKCWNRTYYKDEDELLPLYIHKPNNLQPKNGGSLRRRLLTSKIHQQHDRLQQFRHWDGTPGLKTTQTHHSNTFKPMQEDITGRASRHSVSWSSSTAGSIDFIHHNNRMFQLILNPGS